MYYTAFPCVTFIEGAHVARFPSPFPVAFSRTVFSYLLINYYQIIHETQQ